MSIIPLTSFARTALSFYSFPLIVKDATMTTVDGQDKQAITSRSLVGCIDPSGGKRMEQIFGGSVSEGDIMIITEAELYIDDEYVVGSRGKQSFLEYGGLVYRVVEASNWMIQAGVTVYRAARHVKQDVL
jgi:hypothetical protein